MHLSAYWRLMRLDKPVGIWLLWAPTAWALWFAADGRPPLYLVVYFFLGCILMRSAGCVVNDIADRNVDKYVQRTTLRPLTCGEISLSGAVCCLFLLLLMAACILFQLPRSCMPYAFLATILMSIYPLTKRFFKAPQLFLGFAFSVGIPMAYAAIGRAQDSTMWLLCLLNILWILIYDTLYALVDREDDLRLELHSTAIMVQGYENIFLRVLSIVTHCLWLILAWTVHLDWLFYLIWFIGLTYWGYQDQCLKCHDRNEYFQAFKNNAWYGILMWIGLVAGFDSWLIW